MSTPNNIYDYMHGLDIMERAQGLDALTITSLGLDGKISIDIVLHSLRDQIEIERPKAFRFQGATGKAWGSIRYATKWNELGQRHWAILMVTGKSSQAAFREALKVKDVKFTRVDTYIDVKLAGRALGLPRKLYDTYKGDCSKKLIEGLMGDTLYVGSRQSESMIRIYDKSPEYGEELGKVWRFEVEYKSALAGGVASYLSEYGNSGIDELVWSECKDKGLPVPAVPNKTNVLRDMATLSSAEMKLNWLGRQVSPTVTFLRRLGLEGEVYRQLGLDLPV